LFTQKNLKFGKHQNIASISACVKSRKFVPSCCYRRPYVRWSTIRFITKISLAMKTALMTIAIVCTTLSAFAQQPGLTIRATIQDLPAGKWVYYREQGGDDKRDSVKTHAGGFSLHIPIHAGEGNNYMISIERNFEDANSLLFLYLDEGDLEIEGEGPLFKGATFSGSPWVHDYNDFLDAVGNEKIVALREK